MLSSCRITAPASRLGPFAVMAGAFAAMVASGGVRVDSANWQGRLCLAWLSTGGAARGVCWFNFGCLSNTTMRELASLQPSQPPPIPSMTPAPERCVVCLICPPFPPCMGGQIHRLYPLAKVRHLPRPLVMRKSLARIQSTACCMEQDRLQCVGPLISKPSRRIS